KLKFLQLQKEEALKNKTSLLSRLEAFQENYGDDIHERLDRAKSKLDEQKTLLSYWKNILHIFYEQKNKLSQNPMDDLSKSFSAYLSEVSGGGVTCEFPEADKLNMNILSRDRFVSYDQLSEGTKETVSLCFRLAVLEHLFPQGGGVIVFDDPFSDMDADRRNQACKLVKKCAERHQVIFLTCHCEYEELLNTKPICIA
ncbi:MAG: ATP-binding protein, partial [Acutalibacteraceae bacterium]